MNFDAELIEACFKALKPYSSQFSDHFYKVLFKKYPETVSLLKTLSREERNDFFFSSLEFCVTHAKNEENLEAFLKKLGTQSSQQGLVEFYLPWGKHALIETLSYFFEDNWTAEAEQAWVNYYDIMVGFMKKGMNSKKHSQEADLGVKDMTNTIELEEVKVPGLAEFARNQAQELLHKVLEEEVMTKAMQKKVRERARQILKEAIEKEMQEQIAHIQRQVS